MAAQWVTEHKVISLGIYKSWRRDEDPQSTLWSPKTGNVLILYFGQEFFSFFCKAYVLSVTFYALEVCKIWVSFSFILCFLTFFSFSIFLFLAKQAFSQVQSIISIYLRNFAKIVLIDDKITTYCKVISAGEIFVSICLFHMLQHSYASFFIKLFTWLKFQYVMI